MASSLPPANVKFTVRGGRTEKLLLKPGELAAFLPATPTELLTGQAPLNAPLYAACTSRHRDASIPQVAEVIALL